MDIGSISNRNYNVATSVNNGASNSNSIAFGDLLNSKMSDNIQSNSTIIDESGTTIIRENGKIITITEEYMRVEPDFDNLDQSNDLDVIVTTMTSSITQTGELTDDQIVMFNAKYDFENMTTNSVQFDNFMNDLYNMGIISREFDETDLNISDFYDLTHGGILTKVGETKPDQTIEELLTEALEKYEEYYEKVKEQGGALDLVEDVFKNYYETYQMLEGIMNTLTNVDNENVWTSLDTANIEEVAIISENPVFKSDVLTDEELAYAVDNLLYTFTKNGMADDDDFLKAMEKIKTDLNLSTEEFCNYVDARKEIIEITNSHFSALGLDFTLANNKVEIEPKTLSELSDEEILNIKEQYNNGEFETKADYDEFLKTLVDYGLISESTMDTINYDAVSIGELNEAYNNLYDTVSGYAERYGRPIFYMEDPNTNVATKVYSADSTIALDRGTAYNGYIDGYIDEEFGKIYYPEDLVINYLDSDWNGNTDYWLDFLSAKYENLYDYLDENSYSTAYPQNGIDAIEELKNLLNQLDNM